ncbi:hypothetical protein [Marinibactrum halimedae]|uniref:Uncharacterized protein n=1 Tax=Marinibactrum halimedae TaxID=1444977 RepID=A0AA37T3X8_9GAMM|nr:hypothetical protein [Marinibactrum halimedae]MCD9458575.1 hypothetical protein [Marinibactrum halimedae]GLS26558.1 hypothetical protein GCM10007877_22740 [Marinibactrum halimedae]
MGFLSSIFSKKSKERFSKPNFDSSPKVDIDFSGTHIQLTDPPHNANFPVYDEPCNLDIYDVFENGFFEDEDGRSKRFYVRGWNFLDYSNKKKHAGGVLVKIVISDFGVTYCSETNKHSLSNYSGQVFPYHA